MWFRLTPEEMARRVEHVFFCRGKSENGEGQASGLLDFVTSLTEWSAILNWVQEKYNKKIKFNEYLGNTQVEVTIPFLERKWLSRKKHRKIHINKLTLELFHFKCFIGINSSISSNSVMEQVLPFSLFHR